MGTGSRDRQSKKITKLSVIVRSPANDNTRRHQVKVESLKLLVPQAKRGSSRKKETWKPAHGHNLFRNFKDDLTTNKCQENRIFKQNFKGLNLKVKSSRLSKKLRDSRQKTPHKSRQLVDLRVPEKIKFALNKNLMITSDKMRNLKWTPFKSDGKQRCTKKRIFSGSFRKPIANFGTRRAKPEKAKSCKKKTSLYQKLKKVYRKNKKGIK